MQLDRYSRQMLFSPIGEDGQKHLQKSKVVVIGCGALGSNIANNLVRAGVGKLKICDRDFAELTNLQRQLLLDEKDVEENLPKAEAIAKKLRQINSEVIVEPIVTDINFTNIESIIKEADLVLDGTDNFDTRFLLNDACVKHRIPWIYGGCIGSYGMAMSIIPDKTPCFRCILSEVPAPGSTPTCETIGILNTIVNIVSSIQSNEAIKFLTGNTNAMLEGIIAVDIWTNSFQVFKVQRDSKCITCALKQFEFLDAKETGILTMLCGRNAVQIAHMGTHSINIEVLASKLMPIGKVIYNKFLLKFYIDNYELTIFPDGRAIIAGTKDFAKAKSLYARYIGV